MTLYMLNYVNVHYCLYILHNIDGDCSGSAEVVVTVADVNDNRPRFISQLYSGGQ